MSDSPNRSRAILGLFAACVVAALLVFGPTRAVLSDTLLWLQQAGPVGGLVFVVIYVVATVILLPGTILTLGAGFLYGPLWGTVVVSTGSTIGALCAFAVGRYLAGDWVRAQLARRPRLHAVIRAVEGDALKVVLLLRLVPLFPFNILNYSLGLTDISWRKFLLASWLGMLPGTFAYVSVGAAAGSLTRAMSSDGPPDTGQIILWVVGAIALVAAVTLVSRRARAELEAIESSTPADGR